jgi:DNA-binding protein YbaB
MVEIDMNGRIEMLDLRISQEVMSDRDMLQDLIRAAFTSAMEKIREQMSRQMGNMMGMAGLAGLMGNQPGSHS